MIIKTGRFILRPYQAEDLGSLVESINNKNVSRYLARVPYPYTRKDGQEWLGKCQQEDSKKEPAEINFVIDINGKVIGSIGFSKIENNQAEFGYWLAESYWNQGIMTEAAKLVIDFGFQQLGLKKIYAHVFEPNTASMKVLEKTGFENKGLMQEKIKKDGKFYNRHLFVKTALS